MAFFKTTIFAPLIKSTIKIGRAPDNDIVLTDQYVSGRHAEITHAGINQYILIEEKNVTNNLKVNGKKLRDLDCPYSLEDGDEIQIGNSELIFHIPKMQGETARKGTTLFVSSDPQLDNLKKNKENILLRKFIEIMLQMFVTKLKMRGGEICIFKNGKHKLCYSYPTDDIKVDKHNIKKIRNGEDIAQRQNELYVTLGSKHSASGPIGYIYLVKNKKSSKSTISNDNFVELYDLLETTIGQTQENQSLKNENRLLKQAMNKSMQIIGESDQIKRIRSEINKVAKMDATVLITGESGTGKELAARAIHAKSKRSNKPFTPINCAAIPAELLETELFGSEPGAYTGVTKLKIGKFEAANGGTIFLDEIADLRYEHQAKLLRVLQEREFTRVGGNKCINVDILLVCATNKNLVKEVQEGRFREDLYYRIDVFSIEIPPIRERIEDIPILFEYFMESLKGYSKEIASEAIDYLKNYHWPGNIRELRNVTERCLLECSNKSIIELKDIEHVLRGKNLEITSETLNLKKAVEILEKKLIPKALKLTNNNKSQAAKILNIDRETLGRKMEQYGL